MSFSYERYDKRWENRSRRSALGYWVPLAVTVTLATAGLAAWAWSEWGNDSSSSSDDDDDLSYGEDRGPLRNSRQPEHGNVEVTQDDEGLVARMSGAIRRTPSPQQLIDGASRRVSATVAAAGAMVGGALTSIREESHGNDHFGDHTRWSEEAEMNRKFGAQREGTATTTGEHSSAFNASIHDTRIRSDNLQMRSAGIRQNDNKKTVAVVLSAEAVGDEHNLNSNPHVTENASLLSHLSTINHDTTNLLILMYAPHLKSRPSSPGTAAPPSLGSSYTAISSPMPTPGEELAALEPEPYSVDEPTSTSMSANMKSASALSFTSLRNQALNLVSSPSNVMPFATPTGHVHMLRHLAPSLIYMTENLSGDRGENVEMVKAWVGQIIIVVGVDEGAMGGLIDTEDEEDGAKAADLKQKWWEHSGMVGLGKGTEVVEAFKVREDWERRVSGRE